MSARERARESARAYFVGCLWTAETRKDESPFLGIESSNEMERTRQGNDFEANHWKERKKKWNHVRAGGGGGGRGGKGGGGGGRGRGAREGG